MYVMVLYAAASWAGILLYDVQCLLSVSSFGAIWALINTIKNKQLDAGWISMGLVALASSMGISSSVGMYYLQIAGCLLAAFNFVIPFLVWPKFEKLVKNNIRSTRWLNVFKFYLLVMVFFWVYSAYKIVASAEF